MDACRKSTSSSTLSCLYLKTESTWECYTVTMQYYRMAVAYLNTELICRILKILKGAGKWHHRGNMLERHSDGK